MYTGLKQVENMYDDFVKSLTLELVGERRFAFLSLSDKKAMKGL